MLTLIVNGEVYSPEPLGAIDLLVAGDKIGKLGQVDDGRRMVAHGRLNVAEPFLKQSNRTVTLQGRKHKDGE